MKISFKIFLFLPLFISSAYSYVTFSGTLLVGPRTQSGNPLESNLPAQLHIITPELQNAIDTNDTWYLNSLNTFSQSFATTPTPIFHPLYDNIYQLGISFEVGGGLPTDPQPGMSFCAVIYTSLGVIYLYTDPSWVIPPDGSNTGFPFVLNLSPTIYFDGQQPIGAVIDSDEDGTIDEEDAFPNDPNEDTDTDGDDIGNNADTDDDNDGYLDINDAFPLVASEWLDTDGDNIGDNADTDDDNDGYLDINDALPLVASEWLDTDGDTIGNNADADDDNDGVGDNAETNTGIWVDLNNTGTDPFSSDTDNDLLLDGFESAIGRNPNVGENFSSLTPSFELIIDPFAANIDTFNKVSNSDVWDSSQGFSILSFEGSILYEDLDDGNGVINIFDGIADTDVAEAGDVIISPHSPIEFSIPHKKVVRGFYIYTDNDRSTDGVKISYSVDGGNSYVISCDLDFNTRLTSRTDGDYSHLHGLHAVFKIDIPDIYADHFKIEFSPSNSRLIGEYPRIYEVDAIEGNAADDIDGDGLNFIEEDALGTDWHDSDTDGDGLSDGDEVNVYACNPLSVDTDGDGYRDDLEVFLSNFNVNSDSSDLVLSDYGLITMQNIQDLRAGSTIIEVSGNQATVQLQMEESSDLQTWEDTGTPATMTIPADTDTKFFRFKMAE